MENVYIVIQESYRGPVTRVVGPLERTDYLEQFAGMLFCNGSEMFTMLPLEAPDIEICQESVDLSYAHTDGVCGIARRLCSHGPNG